VKKRTLRLGCRLGAGALLAGGLPIGALDPQKAVTQYNLDAWQLEDGLPQSSILDLVQTGDGFLWLATYEGVARFDGKTFVTLTAPSTRPVRDQHILTLAEGAAGDLWLGTQDGAHRLDGDDLESWTVADGLGSNVVQAFQVDPAGRVWIGTQAGLSVLEDGRVSATYTAEDGLAHADVRALLEDRRGRLWIGTQKGLSRFEGGRFETLTAAGGEPVGEVICLFEDRGGGLWIGTLGSGLVHLEDGGLRRVTAAEGLPSDFVSALFEDDDGNLWIGTQDRGLVRRSSGGRFEVFSREHGLSDDHVKAILEDREGSLWIGTFSGGLNRLKDGKFTPLTTWQGLPDDLVLPILETRSGDLWLGTQSGLSRLRDGVIETWDTSDGLANDFVWSLAETRDGAVWAGTWGGGVSRWADGAITTTLTTADGLANNDVRAILEDREGSLWIGTWGGGLDRLRDGRLTSLTTADGLGSDFVTSLFEDRDGALWIGTNGGLSRLRDGRLDTYTAADGIAHDVILSFHQDAEGTLWIGTEGGLTRWRDGEPTSFTTDDGLFNNRFFQIMEDRRGNLWTACNKGIFRVARQQLEDLAAGRIERLESVSYGTADGMLSHECNGGFQPAGCQTRDGVLWFPTIRGAVAIDPEHVETNPLPPPVVAERLIAGGETLEPGSGAALEPRGRDFEIHYTALSFLDPDKVRFRYQLEPYDSGWVEAGTRRVAYYTNLPPGAYLFRVVACNNDGLWNEDGDSLQVYLRPAFWERWIFVLACTLAAALLGWGVYRLRVRRLVSRNLELQAMKDELEDKNTEIRTKNDELSRFTYTVSHDLKGPLVTIQGFLGFMEKDLAKIDGDTARARSDINRIRAAAASMSKLLDELLELSRIGRLDNPHQRVSLYDVAREALDLLAGQVAARDVEALVAPSLPVVVGDRPRLLAVFQNLIDNAIKFTGHGERPRIEIGVAGDELRRPGETPVCYVRDHGKGIDPRYHQKIFQLFDQLDPEVEGTGAGLAIVHRIIERHGGRIWVASEGSGQGATFYFTFAEKEV